MKNRLRTLGSRFAQFTADVIYDRRTEGKAVRAYGAFLNFFSYGYSAVVRLRTWLYEKRIFHTQPLGCMVIVVGNLTMGGTGKTPVVEKFARSLNERGRKVAILSRGYKSKKEPAWRVWWRKLLHKAPPAPKVVSDGERVLLTADEAGDEPFMLARNLPGVVVLVDKNRVKAGEYAVRRFGSDTLLLDDGFQYLPLKGRLNLLLVDKTNPFGNGRPIPRGILREPIKHLKRASYVFITKSDGSDSSELRAQIEAAKPGIDVIECTHRPQYLQSLDHSEKRPLEDLKDRQIASFSGIATPETFEAFLRQFGAELRYNRRFLDHHRFDQEEIDTIFSQAKEAGAEYVVTTEKDAARLDPDFQPPMPCYFLRLEIDILEGAKDFDAAVSRVCFPKQKIATTRPPMTNTTPPSE